MAPLLGGSTKIPKLESGQNGTNPGEKALLNNEQDQSRILIKFPFLKVIFRRYSFFSQIGSMLPDLLPDVLHDVLNLGIVYKT